MGPCQGSDRISSILSRTVRENIMTDVEYVNWVRRVILEYIDDVGSAELWKIREHLQEVQEKEGVVIPRIDFIEPAASLLMLGNNEWSGDWGPLTVDHSKGWTFSLNVPLEKAIEHAKYRPWYVTESERRAGLSAVDLGER